MPRFAFVVVAAALLAACADQAVPEGYKGPLALVADSTEPTGRSSANVFYLSVVNGRTVDDSTRATAQANAGRGLEMTPVAVSRQIPAEPSTVTIVGLRIYAAPILAIMRPSYAVKGEVKFTPKPGGFYHVKGVIEKGHSAVWIADDLTGELVSEVVETKAKSAASGE